MNAITLAIGVNECNGDLSPTIGFSVISGARRTQIPQPFQIANPDAPSANTPTVVGSELGSLRDANDLTSSGPFGRTCDD